MKLFFFLIFVLSFELQATLKTKIDLVQQESLLTFKVKFENNGTTYPQLQLTAQARITQFGNIKITKNEQGIHLIQLIDSLNGFIHYQIPIDSKKSFFKSGLDVWHPVNPQFPEDSIFEVQTQLSPGYEFSHSATGYPQDSLAYSFGEFKKYTAQDKRLIVLLSNDDPTLATTLLENLKKYLDFYEKSIGGYPYKTFTVIEAPNEIGYAFPQMTWIGSQLLRFPFILKTSLPHELLHSWWGTGVFVDYDKGNWCEGLTTFGADYGLLNSEEKKLYRIKALTSYLNYVKDSQELSLSQFISRGEDRSLQALGYDKALMVFVMLEQLIGEQNFALGLRTFYADFKFKTASWDDILNVMSKVSGKNLSSFKNNWIQKPGYLSQNFIQLISTSNGIKAKNSAVDIGKIPDQSIQTLIHSKSKSENLNLQVTMDGKNLSESSFPQFLNAQSYSLDPDFYLFRDLSRGEKPLNFSEFFGSSKVFYLFSNSSWMESFKSTYPEKVWVPYHSSMNWESSQTLLVDISEAINNSEIKKALDQKGIFLNETQLTLEKQKFNLNQEAAFISIKIKNVSVFIVSFNSQLPLSRWLARWSRYGGQSYIVLSPASSSLQGVWVDQFKVPLSFN